MRVLGSTQLVYVRCCTRLCSTGCDPETVVAVFLLFFSFLNYLHELTKLFEYLQRDLVCECKAFERNSLIRSTPLVLVSGNHIQSVDIVKRAKKFLLFRKRNNRCATFFILCYFMDYFMNPFCYHYPSFRLRSLCPRYRSAR